MIERLDRAVLVRSPKLVFTAAQMAFVEQDSGIQQAQDRLGRAIQAMGAGASETILMNQYFVAGVGDVPKSSSFIIEGLTLDANVAVEVVAAVR